MKAMQCQQFGPPESLIMADVAPMVAADKEVIINVMACGVNFPDTLIIQNKYQFKPALPFAPGGEVAGVIASVGAEVKHLKAGDRVFALTGWGGFAEQVAINANRVFKMAPGMDFVLAASTMYTYGTSYHALKDRAALQAGETLLVLGAAGGVGLAAVELGKLMGATVIAAASSEEKLALCTAKGADMTINYTTEDLKERIKELTGGKGVDVIYDPVGDKYAEPAIRSMAWKGRYLVVGFAAGDIPKIPLNLALLKGCAIMGVFWGSFAEREPQNNLKNFMELLAHFQTGKLRPHIHKLYSLEETPDALNDLLNRKVIGKAVVKVQDWAVEEKPVFIAKPSAEGSFDNLKSVAKLTGQSLGTSDWIEISQTMVDQFAESTLDNQWIHVDVAKAKAETPFGGTIAHGFMVLSFAPKMLYAMMPLASAKMSLNYGTDKVRFISPVPTGSRVRMNAVLKLVEFVSESQAKIFIECTFELENSTKPACVATLISMVYE
jgi:NADPH:quinone reductase